MTKATGNHATTDRVSKRAHKSIDRIAGSAGGWCAVAYRQLPSRLSSITNKDMVILPRSTVVAV